MGTPANLISIFPKVPGRTFFRNLSEFDNFCSGPISVDPSLSATKERIAALEAAAKQQEEKAAGIIQMLLRLLIIQM